LPIAVQTISWVLIALSLLLAGRLAMTAYRQKSLPEALMAGFFAGGAAGYSALMLTVSLGMAREGAETARNIGNVAFLMPHIAVVVFTARVFRPNVAWARVLAAVLVVGTVGTLIAGHALSAHYGTEEYVNTLAGVFLFWVGFGVRTVAFGWASLEALIYYRSARKRAAIGIGDPLVANRFLLWSLWSGMAVIMTFLRVTANALADPAAEVPHDPMWIVFGQIVASLVCAASVYLTFAAPRFYREWVIRAYQS
jgi:hypothetical protein